MSKASKLAGVGAALLALLVIAPVALALSGSHGDWVTVGATVPPGEVGFGPPSGTDTRSVPATVGIGSGQFVASPLGGSDTRSVPATVGLGSGQFVVSRPGGADAVSSSTATAFPPVLTSGPIVGPVPPVAPTVPPFGPTIHNGTQVPQPLEMMAR